jgi:hypothetical protein
MIAAGKTVIEKNAVKRPASAPRTDILVCVTKAQLTITTGRRSTLLMCMSVVPPRIRPDMIPPKVVGELRNRRKLQRKTVSISAAATWESAWPI